jgi:AraC-like DNA-binding protein
MSFASPLPVHLRPRREKVFGEGRPRALDRNAKARIMHLARALSRRTEPGKAYGQITAKAVAVLEALLWGFHNARSGLCFPSYETIAERAGCARSTVAEALKALEACGLLTWVNRIVRVRERCADLFGHLGSRIRVLRTTNGYQFNDPKGAVSRGFASKSDFQSGTTIQDSTSLVARPAPPQIDPSTELGAALLRFKNLFQSPSGPK